MGQIGTQKILEIRWHGRGGQGAVASAEMFALAAIEEGKFAQAFPSFGPERRGAPVMAFTRISNEFIYIRTGIRNPDIVVVLDSTVMNAVDVTAGLAPDGTLLLNTSKKADEISEQFKIKQRIAVVNATKIAMDEIGRPITNTTMMGALARVTGIVKVESLAKQIEKRFPSIAEQNIKALKRAYEEVT